MHVSVQMRSATGLRGLLLVASLARGIFADTALDYAPDLSKSTIPPYPPLTNPDGSNITVENLRGTRLFGFDGCRGDEQKYIKEAYDDLHTLMSDPEVYNSIDWNDPITKDFFGAASGQYTIPNDRRAQIQHVFGQLEQLWSTPWTGFYPPWLSYRYLWIWVRCSADQDTGDPENVCRDQPKSPPDCGAPPHNPPGNGDNRLEAYTNPFGKTYLGVEYTQTTFCKKFFQMDSLSEAIESGKDPALTTPEQQNNLVTWNNRARVFVHEAAHYNYFIDADAQVPYVDDVTFPFKDKTGTVQSEGYGPEHCRILKNYRKIGKGGFYTQRNADTYAWFAVANYVRKQFGSYPTEPNPGGKTPIRAPRDGDNQPFFADDAPADETSDNYNYGIDTNSTSKSGYTFPGCIDKISGVGTAISLQKTIPVAEPTCDANKASEVPSNVFSTLTGNVYDKFCATLTLNNTHGLPVQGGLTWTFDASGNKVATSPQLFTRAMHMFRIIGKRTPPPNPAAYAKDHFVLTWTPGDFTNNLCNRQCSEAYATIVKSSCGHAGNAQTNLAASASIDVGCGSYSLSVVTT